MKIQDINAVYNAYKPKFDFVNNKSVGVQNSGIDTVSVSHAENHDTVNIKTAQQISEQEKLAKAQEEIQKQKDEMALKQAEMDEMKAQFEASQKELEAVKEAFDILIKCIKISGNIIRGDKVPASDHQFLMENDHELYMVSVTCALPNDEPKDAEQVVKKERGSAEQAEEFLPENTVTVENSEIPQTDVQGETQVKAQAN